MKPTLIVCAVGAALRSGRLLSIDGRGRSRWSVGISRIVGVAGVVGITGVIRVARAVGVTGTVGIAVRGAEPEVQAGAAVIATAIIAAA